MTTHSHDNAPATRLLATHCAVCNRPLVDAQSVETGIGPVCRQRYGDFTALTEAARVEANGIVYRVAATLSQDPSDASMATLATDLQRLRTLGADTIVDRILANRSRLAAVKIFVNPADTDRFAIGSPRNEQLTGLFRSVQGRKWHGRHAWQAWGVLNNVNTFPRHAWPQVRDALRTVYGDAFVRLPDGGVAILTADAQPGFDVPAAPAVDPAAPADAVTVTVTDTTRYDRYRRRSRPVVAVRMPYSVPSVDDLRGVPSRRWVAGDRVNTFDVADLPAVLEIVQRHWPDAVIVDRRASAVPPARRPAPVHPRSQAARTQAEAPLPGTAAGAPTLADTWISTARQACDDYCPEVSYNGQTDHFAWLAESMAHVFTVAGFRAVTRDAQAAMINNTPVVVYVDRDRDAVVVASGDRNVRVPRSGPMSAIVTAVINAAEAYAAA